MNAKQIIEEIADAFPQKNNAGYVDLAKMRDHLKKEKNISELHIFLKKLNQLKLDSIRKSDFMAHFKPDVTNERHFDHVFNLIDTDGSKRISKGELEQLNKDYQLNLTANDIQLMIAMVSRDRQKVEKQDLFQFFVNQ